ncbi:MAG: transporter substrate-binding domain-containing protein [Candidatus Melainabacteria bacterium]|nr:transporter substrate-binding domain-containing protein [Candidatus Melainabacteria bacterium]
MSTPIWTNANRAKQADFSDPLFFNPIFVYARKGDQRFGHGNLDKLNSPDFSIATIDGETAESIAREDFPKARTVSLPQLTDLARMLLTMEKILVRYEPSPSTLYRAALPYRAPAVQTTSR